MEKQGTRFYIGKFYTSYREKDPYMKNQEMEKQANSIIPTLKLISQLITPQENKNKTYFNQLIDN